MERARNLATVATRAGLQATHTRAGEHTVTLSVTFADPADPYWSSSHSLHVTEDAARSLLAGLRAYFAESAEPPYLVN